MYLTATLQGWRSESLSQHSIITYEIHFCTDQAKNHQQVGFSFDPSYDATRMYRQMLKKNSAAFVCFLPKSVALRPCLQNGGIQNTCHLAYSVLWSRHNMHNRCWHDISANVNWLSSSVSMLKGTHYFLVQLLQMATEVVADLRQEKLLRDYTWQFLWGRSQYFASYSIIECLEAFNPVTLWEVWD